MKQTITFQPGGTLKILILSDIQEHRPLSEDNKTLLLQTIQRENPDLIVLLGDMIFGPLLFTHGGVKRVIQSILDVLDAAQIPFVVVFGNHDLDTRVSVQYQMELYRSSPLCLTPAFNERATRQGYTLHCIDPLSKEEQSTLFFLDSGRTYLSRWGISFKGPEPKAIRWSEEELERCNCPCYIFQHVTVYSEYRLLKTVDKGTEGAIPGRGIFKGKQLVLSNEAEGFLGESPSPLWEPEDAQFSGWVRSGKVKAVVFGHDHKNAFHGTVDGIELLQTSCAGLNCYGTDSVRGVRTLTIQASGTYDSHTLFFSKD